MASNVGIIGCGWLGWPLGVELIKKGYSVHGTTTRPEKQQLLEKSGITPYLLKLGSAGNDALNLDLYHCDNYVINIPPGRGDDQVEANYPAKVKQLLDAILIESPRVIFISTTGVYQDTGGVIDEKTTPNPTKSSGKAVLAAEHAIKSQCDDYVILRMAGLVGGNRQPANWIKGKTDVQGGDTPVNMIHLDDCISIIKQLLSVDIRGEVFNAAADLHPNKRDFYTAQAVKMGIKPPTWQNGTLPHKIVSSEKLKTVLGYNFMKPDPKGF